MSLNEGPRARNSHAYTMANPGDEGTRIPTESTDPEAGITHPQKHQRHGFNPIVAVKVLAKHNNIVSSWVNVLLPLIPVGLALHWARPEWNLAIFVTNYIAMIPAANLLSFTSGELALKVPRVFGMVVETSMGAAVEIILCLILLFHGQLPVIKAALLGSMLANLLLCTGLCFIVSGLRYTHSQFNEAVTETGGGMLLLAVAALTLPLSFYTSIWGNYKIADDDLWQRELNLSHVAAICLLIAYILYLFFQLKTHHSYFDQMLDQAEKRDKDAHLEHARVKLTNAEAIFFTAIALTFVTLHAYFMVQQISWVVEHRHISDPFIGLILVPVVEKAAEHLSAVDEAWDDAMDFALSHIFGATLQTALFVAPLVVIISWIAGKKLDLNFEIYQVVVLVFAVLIIGNFIKDNKSNYLEGALLVIFYILIAAGTYWYPNPEESAGVAGSPNAAEGSEGGETTTETAEAVATEVARMLMAKW